MLDGTERIHRPIPECTIIELGGWKVRYGGVHAILDIQHDGGNNCRTRSTKSKQWNENAQTSFLRQPLKQTNTETAILSNFASDYGWELFVITDQGNMP